MRENPLEDKSKALALRVVKLYKYLQARHENVMSKQMLRAGTSIGANVAEAQYAQSKADFATKLSIALKEASETEYWLDLLVRSEYIVEDEASRSLRADVKEIMRLLAASVKTSKKG